MTRVNPLDWDKCLGYSPEADRIIRQYVIEPFAVEWVGKDLPAYFGLQPDNQRHLFALVEQITATALSSIASPLAVAPADRAILQLALQQAWAILYRLLLGYCSPLELSGATATPLPATVPTARQWNALVPERENLLMYIKWEDGLVARMSPLKAHAFRRTQMLERHKQSGDPFTAYCKQVAWAMLSSTLEMVIFLNQWDIPDKSVVEYVTHVRMALFHLLPGEFRQSAEAA